MNKVLLIIGLILVLVHVGSTQDVSGTQISLLTVGPGDDVSSLFGHTALRIYDPSRNLDEVFNYGLFDPSDQMKFIKEFVTGNTQYIVGAYDYSRFLQEYKYYNRWVKEQVLDLTDSQKSEMEDFLRNNVLPANREYLYNFFYDNCSSRVKDLIENILPGYEYNNAPIKETTYRQLLDEYLVGRDWLDFGIDIIIAQPGDEVIDHHGQMFLPDYLMTYMDRFKDAYGKPLVAKTLTVLQPSNDIVKSSLITPFRLFGFLLLIEVILFFFRDKWKSKWIKVYDNTWFIIVSLASALLLFMLTTLHTACYPNWNLLWLSPLFIPFTILQFMNAEKWIKWIGFAIIGILVITIGGWTMWPQVLPSVGLLIAVILVFKVVRNLNKPLVQ